MTKTNEAILHLKRGGYVVKVSDNTGEVLVGWGPREASWLEHRPPKLRESEKLVLLVAERSDRQQKLCESMKASLPGDNYPNTLRDAIHCLANLSGIAQVLIAELEGKLD